MRGNLGREGAAGEVLMYTQQYDMYFTGIGTAGTMLYDPSRSRGGGDPRQKDEESGDSQCLSLITNPPPF